MINFTFFIDSIISEDNDLIDITVELKDGNLHCTFDRPQLTNVSSEVFDLDDPYYLLVARGPIKSEAFQKSPLGKSFTYLIEVFIVFLKSISHRDLETFTYIKFSPKSHKENTVHYKPRYICYVSNFIYFI